MNKNSDTNKRTPKSGMKQETSWLDQNLIQERWKSWVITPSNFPMEKLSLSLTPLTPTVSALRFQLPKSWFFIRKVNKCPKILCENVQNVYKNISIYLGETDEAFKDTSRSHWSLFILTWSFNGLVQISY